MWRQRSIALLLIWIWTAASAGAAGTALRFSDVSVAAGVSGDTYHSPTGHSLGVNWIDVDLDGWPDLFVVGDETTSRPHLFRNNRDGTFSRADHWLPSLPQIEMTGSIFADYDRDGDLDIFIYTDNEDWQTRSPHNPPDGHPNLLLHNLWMERGRSVPANRALFDERAAAAGLEDLAVPPLGDLPAYRSKTAAWLDYDRDGCIDLYVGHLVINSTGATANRDRFFRNRCDGTFADVTATIGIDPTLYRGALASGGFHLDGDLWPDLYVVNVSALDPQPYPNDLLYINQGGASASLNPKGGSASFVEMTGSMMGIGDDAQAGMGIDVGDPDLDGDWDLYISDLIETTLDATPRGNVFYQGQGGGQYADNSAPAAGVVGDNSWGVNFFDADNDGDEDLFVATLSNAEDQEILYRNDGVDDEGQLRFTDVADAAGLVTGDSRGSAVADYDRDGDMDLAIVNHFGSLQLFRNDGATSRWIVVELRGTQSSTDGIGTVVEVKTGSLVRKRQVKGGSSAHSQDALAVHVGVGDAMTVDQIRIRWSSGLETVLETVPTNRYVTVVEGAILADGFESGDLSIWSP